MRKLQAYTLLEMIVVLGVIGFTMIFGAIGITRFRNSIELSNAVSDISTYIRTLQNNARNSVTNDTFTSLSGGGPSSTPSYYQINITGNDFNFAMCSASGINTVGTCYTVEENVKAGGLESITFDSDCENIVFEKSTGDIYQKNPNGSLVNTGTCTITLEDSQINVSKDVIINLETNNIEEQE